MTPMRSKLTILTCFALFASANFGAAASILNLAQYVNPFIGTSPTLIGGEVHRPFPFNTGNVYPGAVAPEGMVQFSPDTSSNQAGGYWYPDKIIKAFSLTHFSGRGIPYEGDLGFMPVAGEMTASTDFTFRKFESEFSHDHEKASAGYYKVVLNNGNAVELTATTRTGMMRETYPAGTGAGSLLLYIGNSVRGAKDGHVDIVGGKELTGFVDSYTSGGQVYRLYFSTVFDRSITACGTWTESVLTPGSITASGAHCGAYVTFDTSKNKLVHVTSGISYVSVANAQLNRATEDGNLSFDSIRQATERAWNNKLHVIQVNDPKSSKDSLTVFYTELYRCLLHPNIFEDVNGQYIGFDKATHSVEPGHHFYTHLEGWGGYRSESPILAFLTPKDYGDIAQSYVEDSKLNRGCVPRWVQQDADSKGNMGDGGTNWLANAFAFGIKGFDTEAAMRYMDANASASNGYRENGKQFRDLGWVAGDDGMTVEYSITDLAVAEAGKKIGRMDIFDRYKTTAQNWRNIFNPTTLSIQGRDAAGNWVRGISYEGSDEQYNWLVPHNVRGLFDAMGGSSKVIPRLDAFFGWDPATQTYTKLNTGYGGTAGSGFGGDSPNNYAGDETCEALPWLYLYSGTPWKTQKLVRDIQTTLYTNTPGGMPGNDDGGELASWYIFSALGIYPMITGVGGFVIGSPLFAHATVTTQTGHILKIDGYNAAPANPYVQRLRVNGKLSTHLWLPVDTILNNQTTTFSFALGAAPDMTWANAPADAPPSFDGDKTTP